MIFWGSNFQPLLNLVLVFIHIARNILNRLFLFTQFCINVVWCSHTKNEVAGKKFNSSVQANSSKNDVARSRYNLYMSNRNVKIFWKDNQMFCSYFIFLSNNTQRSNTEILHRYSSILLRYSCFDVYDLPQIFIFA